MLVEKSRALTYEKEKKMAKIDLRNSVTECAQSVKKENAGKYYNYGIKDCMKSIAAQRR